MKQARLNAGLSQKSLGIAAGLEPSIASSRINRYELGVHKADFVVAEMLAAVLNVPAAFLYARDDELAELIALFDGASAEQRNQVLNLLRTPSQLR